MNTTFSFRQRFDISPSSRLEFPEREVALWTDGIRRIRLASRTEAAIDETHQLSLRGDGYATFDEASRAGLEWRQRIQRVMSSLGVGADFGVRGGGLGGASQSLLDAIRDEHGVVILNDSWDVMVFPSNWEPRFLSLGASFRRSSPQIFWDSAMQAALNDHSEFDEIAYDLLSASMRVADVADARLVLLVMALERLARPADKKGSILGLIGGLIEKVAGDGAVSSDERSALTGHLKSFLKESKSVAAQRLASAIPTELGLEDPQELVREGFKLRNLLVHGGTRPDIERVRMVGAQLERVVAELATGESVMSAVRETRRTAVTP